MGAFPDAVVDAMARRPFELLGLCRRLPAGGFTWQPRPGLRSIRGVLFHMLEAEEYWVKGCLKGEPRPQRDPMATDTPDALEQVWRPLREETVAWLRALAPGDLLELRPLPGDPRQMRTVGEILWHWITHEFHHKGQVATRLALLGVEVPDLDLLR